MNVVALLLAAGQSSRAGAQNKLLYPYLGQLLVEHLAGAIKASRVSRCLAVTGHQHEAVEAVLEAAGITCLFNPHYATGMASSLVAGVSAVMDVDAVIVCLGDMPHIDSTVIDALIEQSMSQPQKSLLVPCFNGQRGHPVLIRRSLFEEVLTLSGDRGAKRLFSDWPDTVKEVNVDSPGILQDYDTADALAELAVQRKPDDHR